MLEMPTRDEIVSRIVFRMAGQTVPLTDFTIISTTRILMTEMIVEELLRLHAALIRANADWFLDTDSVTALDRRLADFQQTRADALSAFGKISVTVDDDTEVAAGTVVRTDPQDGSAPVRYTVDANTSPDADWGDTIGATSWHIGADKTRDLPITAVEPGPGWNVGVGMIRVPETTIQHYVQDSLTNAAPVEGGTPAATNAEFLQAFRDFLARLNRGTRPSILAALRNFSAPGSLTPRVLSAALVEWDGRTLLRPPGQTRSVSLIVYIDGGGAGRRLDGAPGDPISDQPVADEPLITAVEAFLRGDDTELTSGQVVAGVAYAVLAAKSLAIPIALDVWVDASVSTATAGALVTNAILTHFRNIPCSGRTVLGEVQGQFSLAHLNRDILNIPAVQRTVFNSPTGDRAIPVGYKAVAGKITLSVTVETLGTPPISVPKTTPAPPVTPGGGGQAPRLVPREYPGWNTRQRRPG